MHRREMEERPRVLNVRMTPIEVEMVKTLAAEDGVSISSYVRQFIRKQHRARFGDAHRAVAKTKKRARA
jgi:predicted DNA binding CopG/RHH family protein